MSPNSRNGSYRNKYDAGSQQPVNPNLDPIYEYYTTNEALVRNDSLVQTILYFFQTELFSDGIQFIKDTEILVPPDDFHMNVDHYWIPFLYKALRFIFARGYLIYTIYVNDKKVMIPDVPEFEMLSVHITAHERTGATIINVAWESEARKRTPLYVFNSQSPFAVTPLNVNAPVDRIKSYLRQWYQLAENRSIASYYNSRPPLIVQHPQTRQSTKPGTDDLGNIDDDLEAIHLDTIRTLGIDDLYVARIRNLGSQQNRTYQEAAKSNTRAPWHIKSAERQRDRPESRLMYIPHGLQYTAAPLAAMDADYLNAQSAIVEQIYTAFGVPYSSIFKPSANQSTTSIEVQKMMLTKTLKLWWGMFSIILTDVYRIMHNVTGPTVAVDNYGEQITGEHLRKFGKHDPDSDFDDDDLFKKTKDNTKLVTVHLKSAFATTAEQSSALYHEGIISWKSFQRLRLESIGLPPILADPTVEPPMRMLAQTMGEALKLHENPKPANKK